MAQREKGGRVVFIGNIPYGVSEAEIMDVFGACGTVVGFRLVYDKETGSPKGFGFLEYADVDSAAVAVKNLNNHTLHNRTLRVDYSNDNRGTSNQNQNQHDDAARTLPSGHFDMNGPPAARPDPSALPPLPPGIDLPPGVTAFDAISQTISKIETPQLLDFISQLKNLCASNPAQANALLSQAPQLGYAVFQAMMLLGLVDTSIVTQLVATAGPPQPPPQQPPPVVAAPAAPPPMPPYMPQPPSGYPPGYGQPQSYAQPPQHYAPTPPAPQPAYQPPPPQSVPPPVAPPQDPQQAQIMQQVMALTREQIYALPEGARQQVISLRAQYGAPV